ncbi:MAG: hypothetical protein CFH10_01196 [Alphaproteobacteria bacterium MarineAlpha4_Bin2]|nr:MAG: hypothetical protein CFH10_01196 [Alphaproteobacteria bacterium MarineAlpha4_Bin2]
MKENQLNTRDLMEEMLVREIRRLVNAADVTAFVRYYDATLKGGPLDFVHVDPELPESDREVPVSFAFQGIGIWFMCRRYGETFHMRHVIVEIDGDGRFLRGQVGEQEGYWEDFPSYLSDERLLSNIIQAKAA